jgi:hypothetical protein
MDTPQSTHIPWSIQKKVLVVCIPLVSIIIIACIVAAITRSTRPVVNPTENPITDETHPVANPKPTTDGTHPVVNPKPITDRMRDASLFFTCHSIACNQSVPRIADSRAYGRHLDGSAYTKTNVKTEDGISGTDPMYMLTFAAGHPIYTEQEWGYIGENETWTQFCGRPDHVVLDTTITDARTHDSATQALILEEPGVTYILRGNLTVKVLVVRHGARLLIDSHVDGIELRAECILVESGGLLQAGANPEYSDHPVYPGLFTITMTKSPYGYDKMGCLASEYSYHWYCPGARLETMTGMDGTDMMISNSFGPRCFGVGFNGNVELHGSISDAMAPKLTYKGNWNVQGTTETNAYAGTIGEPDLPLQYTNAWSKFEYDGSHYILEHAKATYQQWRPGTQVVITYVPLTYGEYMPMPSSTTTIEEHHPSTLCTPPIFLGFSQTAANLAANQELLEQPAMKDHIRNCGGGVEVATIATIVEDSRNRTIITFVDPLYLPHPSSWTELTDDTTNTTISVDTRAHIGLLTRNIIIQAEYGHDPDSKGANNTTFGKHRPPTGKEGGLFDADLHYNGPGGTLVPDYKPAKIIGRPHENTMRAYINRNVLLDMQFSQCNTDDQKTQWLQTRRATLRQNPAVIRKDPAFAGHFAFDPGVDGTAAAADAYFNGLFVDPSTDPITGCWQLGTAGFKGSNAILGAQTMFRLGSSTIISGVQSIGMGIAANSGNISAYAFHYHLAGWTHRCTDHLPTAAGPLIAAYLNKYQYPNVQSPWPGRRAVLRDSVIQQTGSRVVSIHGSNEVCLSNNISFLNYGSAWFLEEGVERFNTLDHNLAITTLLCRPSMWDNPSPIHPNAGFDNNAASVFWLKHSQNACTRNVMTACPRPVVGVWLINQDIARAKNIASICMGDADRKLPAIGSVGLLGECGDNAGVHTLPEAMYFPEYMRTDPRHICDINGNNAMTASNSTNPMYMLADNVAYNILTYVSTYIGFYPQYERTCGLQYVQCLLPSYQLCHRCPRPTRSKCTHRECAVFHSAKWSQYGTG